MKIYCYRHSKPVVFYTLSLHDALPICAGGERRPHRVQRLESAAHPAAHVRDEVHDLGIALDQHVFERARPGARRSEEDTSELQSQTKLVCGLLLEKKKPERQNYNLIIP